MKSKIQITQRIDELNADERLSYPPADVFVNAPLALIQVAMENELKALNWVLQDDEEETHYAHEIIKVLWEILRDFKRSQPEGAYILEDALFLKNGGMRLERWAELFLPVLDYFASYIGGEFPTNDKQLQNAVLSLKRPSKSKKSKYFRVYFVDHSLYLAFRAEEIHHAFRAIAEKSNERSVQ